MAEDGGITVTGHGSAGAPPDVVRLSLAAEAAHPSVQQALDAVRVALTSMRTVLGDLGIPADDVRSTEASLWSSTDERGGRTTQTARFGLEVTVRRVDDAGQVLAAALDAAGGAGRMQGMAFAHADPRELQSRARAAAMDDALGKARQLATLAGRDLGEVLDIVEGEPQHQPYPVARQRGIALAAGTVPVSGGELEVSAAVTVRWALV